MCSQFLETKIWRKYWKLLFISHKAAKESRLRQLHFKFIHDIYPAKVCLKKWGWGKPVSRMPRDWLHWACILQLSQHQNILERCQAIYSYTNIQTEMNEQTTLFGLTMSDLKKSEKMNKINHILLIAKLTISKHKYGKVKNLRIIFDSELLLRKPIWLACTTGFDTVFEF